MVRRNEKKTIDKKPNENDHKTNKFDIPFYWTIKILISLLILYITYIVAQRLADIILDEVKKHVSQKKKLIIRQLSDIIFYVVFAFGVMIALINMGVQPTTITTLLGTAMVTIGLAAQGTLSNIFSGVYVALSDRFQIGDTIRVYVPFIPNSLIEGKVVDFNMSCVKIEDSRTHKLLFLPNTSVASNVLVNMSVPVA